MLLTKLIYFQKGTLYHYYKWKTNVTLKIVDNLKMNSIKNAIPCWRDAAVCCASDMLYLLKSD